MELYRKYMHKLYPTFGPYECVHENPNGSCVLVHSAGVGQYSSHTIQKEYFDRYIEYVEPPKPKIQKRYIYWIIGKNAKLDSEIHAIIRSEKIPPEWITNYNNVLQIDEVTYTDK